MTLHTPIRILHLITDLDRGGAQRQLVSLVSTSSGDAYEHIVCYLRPPSDFGDELQSKGVTVVGLDVSGSTKWVTAAARLARLVKSYRPDIVQTWLLDANISARLNQLVGPRIPLVTALQNADYDPESIQAANWPRKKVSVLRWVDHFTARLTNPRFVACSDLVMRSARDHLGIPESSLEVIYNSVDPETLRCQPGESQRLRESLAIPPDGVVFLNVGRLDPQKGQEYLLRAFQKVTVAAPNAFLAIAGEGPLRGHLTNLAKELGITDKVRFLGIRTDVGAFLEMSDVFVFPSLFEGLGLALVEAMFKKLPCIVSRIDVLLEVISDQESGLVVAPGSVDELADAMIRLHADPILRKALGVKAEEIAAGRFHQQITTPQWENLYSRITHQQSKSLVNRGQKSEVRTHDKRFMQVIRPHFQRALYRFGWDTRCRNLVPARILKAALRDIPLRTKPMLLDIGCGQLGVAAFLPHVSIMGTDINPPVAAPPNFTFQLGSITALPFADRSFPLVSCIDVLEHLSPQDRERGINELVRVASDSIVLAYPQGKLAADMDEEFRRDCELHGKASPDWLIEHLMQPYPINSTIVEQLNTAVAATGRKATISLSYCEPASVSRIVRRAAARSKLLYAALNLFFGALLPLIRSPNDSNGYRAVALIELSPDG